MRQRQRLLAAFLILVPAAATAGPALRECPDCPELAVIPAGEFVMGSPPGEPGRFDTEGPQHRVTVRAFALGKHNVTVGQFLDFLRDTGYQPAPCNRPLGLSWRSPGQGVAYPPGGVESPHQPAVCVGWQDARAYVAWLNGKVAPAGQPRADAPYRLPSEAEWEYAARAETTTARWWGEALGAGNANCNGCGSRWDNTLFAPVGSFGPNPFGLFDMLGNVWQWTADCWNDSYAKAPDDGRPWLSGDCDRRVLRGGSWSNLPAFVRSAARSNGDISGREVDYASDAGFRVARSIR